MSLCDEVRNLSLVCVASVAFDDLCRDRDLVGRGLSNPEYVRESCALGGGGGRPGQGKQDGSLALAQVVPGRLAGDCWVSEDAEVVVAQLSAHPSAVVTDVASVKERVVTEVRSRAGAQARRYVGSHPMAGRERSGAGAADCDLFAGRPWGVVGQDSDPQAELVIRNLAVDVGATPVRMGAAEHDAAVAAVSHVPQLVSSLVAARLEELGEGALALSGQGLRDVTRIAASDPRLWSAIIVGNAGPVVDLLRRISDDLAALVTGIEAAVCDPDSPEHTAPGAARVVAPGAVGAVTDVMTRGNLGRARIPGKHGGAPRRYTEVQVLVPDAAGELGRLFSDIGAAGVNIEDFSLEHSAGQSAGIALISVLPAVALRLEEALDAQGWRVVAG